MSDYPSTIDLRQDFEAIHGYWNDDLDDLLRVDPWYFRAYDRLLRVTEERGHLSAVHRELVFVAVSSQVTYLNRTATSHHIRQASRLGASAAQIVETLQLAASLGIHSMLVGVPIAHEVFEELGVATTPEDTDLDAKRRALKERFIADRKYWVPQWDTVLAYSPELFEAYLDISSIAWNHGSLPEWFRELVYVAIDVATTHLFTAGIRTHTRKAIDYGATPGQVIDTMTIASNIGIDTVLTGVAAIPRDPSGI